MNIEEIVLEDDILELECVDYYREHVWNHYKNYDNTPIPRVTHIIKQCRDQEALINWASRISLSLYEKIRNSATDVGGTVHQVIDDYLVHKYKLNLDENAFTPNKDLLTLANANPVRNAFENFRKWEECLNNRGYYIEEVYGLEIPVFCPWYGGTIDAIVRINGLNYIIDFKTSKKISGEYLIQAAAYMWSINSGYNSSANLPFVNGIGIIRVSKTTPEFEELFLTDIVPEQNAYMIELMKTFMSFVESYYRSNNVDYIMDKYKKNFIFQAKGE